jgi:23S rRNA pseudouridine1911/1915/1917 synthase
MSESSDNHESYHFTVACESAAQRIDKFLAENLPELSRSRLKALILEGQVRVNASVLKSVSQKTKENDEITVYIPPLQEAEPRAEKIPLDILYEDNALLVINKPAGLVVHPGAGNSTGTLVNALLHHCGDSLSGIGGVRRPGIVHRLDKDTSGLMIAAKSDQAHQHLSLQLSKRTLSRNYIAYVYGVPLQKKSCVDAPIDRHRTSRTKMCVPIKGGRAAKTHYECEAAYQKAAAKLRCKLESGRTHQIRVHMGYIKHPLIGDPLYGLQDNAALSLLKKNGYTEQQASQITDFPRQALHASQIEFIHPETAESMSFEAALPQDLQDLERHLSL